MSEARAITNFSGNAVATVLIGAWTKTIDHDQMKRTLNGQSPSTRKPSARKCSTTTNSKQWPTVWTPTARSR